MTDYRLFRLEEELDFLAKKMVLDDLLMVFNFILCFYL